LLNLPEGRPAPRAGPRGVEGMFPVILAQWLGWFSLALTCVAAVWRGRRPERLGAALVGVAWVLTLLVEQRRDWLGPQVGMFVVDLMTLAGLAALAYGCRRGWAICAAGFQAVAVLTDVVFRINPAAFYRAYYMSNFSIGFLLLGAILVGVFFERDTPAPINPR